MPAAILAGPLRAGSRDDGEMLRVAYLNPRDSFRYCSPPKFDGDPVPSGARIDGMKEGSACTARPNIVAEGGNRSKLDALRDGDLLDGFSAIQGALHLAVGCDAPKGSGGTSIRFEILAGCPHREHGSLGG